jgi:hypothetical protein
MGSEIMLLANGVSTKNKPKNTYAKLMINPKISSGLSDINFILPARNCKGGTKVLF